MIMIFDIMNLSLCWEDDFMKKLLTVLLVVAMTMTMMLSVSAAEPVLNEETGITSLQLFSCDEKPAGTNAYSVDTENAQEGTGCLTFNVAKGQVNEMKLANPIDGTGFDTLEFDLYVSDVGLFDLFGANGMNSGFEITSSGTCDNQEISWKLSEMKASNEGAEIVVGWNHIILPLDTGVVREAGGNDASLNGPFDISRVNFIRFFMVNETADTGIVAKIDNICLTDYDAVTTAAKKEAQAKEKADEFSADVAALAEITADNYAGLKTDVAALRARYNKLNDIAKEYVTKATLDKLEAAEAKIAEFEANPPSNDEGNENTGDTTGTTDSGCGATVALGGVALLVLAGAVMLRKKED